MADLHRRNAIKLAIASMLLSSLPGCTNNPSKKSDAPIHIDSSNVKDLNDLIVAIKKSAGDRLPKNVSIEDLYKSITSAFIDNARKAAELGMEIPDWILNQLPKKVASNTNQVRPEYVVIAILGVMFLVPWTIFFAVIFASIITLTKYITDKLNQRNT